MYDRIELESERWEVAALETLLIVLEFILSILLIVVVILQQSKGEGLGGHRRWRAAVLR